MEEKIVKTGGLFASEEPVVWARWKRHGNALLAVVETRGGRRFGVKVVGRKAEVFRGVDDHGEMVEKQGVAASVERGDDGWVIRTGDLEIHLRFPDQEKIGELKVPVRRGRVGRLLFGSLLFPFLPILRRRP